MSIKNTFKEIRNAINSRRNKKIAKAEGHEPFEGDAVHIDENGGWNPLFIPERPPLDSCPVREADWDEYCRNMDDKEICGLCNIRPLENGEYICSVCMAEVEADEEENRFLEEYLETLG